MPAPADAPPRAIGEVRLTAKDSSRGSQIDQLRQSGSLKLVFPRCDDTLQAVLVNTAGGVTGGDRFEVTMHAQDNAQLSITTQAAERAYRATPGLTGRISTRLSVAAGARLCWLPQETLLFEGCALDRSLRVDLAADARLLMVEPLVFGRLAMKETLRNIAFRDCIDIRRAGMPLYLDRLQLAGDATAHLARPMIAGGAGAMATLVYAGPDAEAYLDAVRRLLPPTGGASVIRAGLLAVRLLAPDSFELRLSLIPVLTLLSGDDLPRPWMT